MVPPIKKISTNTAVKIKIGVKMRWLILLCLVISHSIASNSQQNSDYYDFLQPLVINFDINNSQDDTNRKKLLLKLDNLSKVSPQSNEFYYLNYKLMKIFQYQLFHISIKKSNNKTSQEIDRFNDDKNYFINILKSIKNPSFFTLYSKLYLEILDSKRLKHKDLIKLYSLSSKEQQPYVQLLSYVDSLNQLNSISITDQNNLHKKLTLLLIGLPKKQKEYILRLTALRLLPLYDKSSIEFAFNKLFAQKSTIRRDDILHILNFKDADLFNNYITKEKRSFFEKRVFTSMMKALRRNDIAMILSILYMQKNDFTKARSYLRQTPRDNLYNQYNPFSSSIELNNKRVYKKHSSLRKFAETMSRLEERLSSKDVTAKDFYLYGNGLYNKSYFGNFPMSSVFYRQNEIYRDAIPPTANLNSAYKYYEKALQKSKNEEFRAEVAYQILKIEFLMALTNSSHYLKDMKKMPKRDDIEAITYLLIESQRFIETMQDYKLDYIDTKYGKRVIEESIIFSYL
jgi:hypothetical protein